MPRLHRLRRLSCLFLAWLPAQVALAAEADWLYFPMYERDTAHAVHLSALRFRPDGLLASATRYPMVTDETWPAQQYEQAWYGYEQRLIDCETGHHLETTDSLLDRDGNTIATRPIGHARWVERLAEQLLRRSQNTSAWPAAGGEIFLACAGASSPTLKARRARQAKAASPLIAQAPLTKALRADSDALFAQAEFRLDLKALTRRRAATPAAVLEQLLQQHQAWQKSYNLGGAPSSEPTHPHPPAKDHDYAEGIDSVRQLGAGLVEFESRWMQAWGMEPPARASQARLATETWRHHCTSGFQVPVWRHWRDKDGKSLLQVPVPVKEALDAARGAMHPARALPDAACKPKGPALATPSIDDALAFGLTRAILAQEPTADAMLLKVRAAIRATQP